MRLHESQSDEGQTEVLVIIKSQIIKKMKTQSQAITTS